MSYSEVPIRNTNFNKEFDVSVSSILLAHSVTFTTSRLMRDGRNFTDDSKYVGSYGGVGVGGGLIGGINLGDPPLIVFPVVYGNVMAGYQGRSVFIDVGMRIIPISVEADFIPIPALRCGGRF